MAELKALIDDFLAQKRIAVTGVSRTMNGSANGVYKKLRDAGYTVFAVNPNAESVEGDACYANLAAIPDGVDAVMIVNRPEITEQIVQDCAELGIKRVWMHRSFDSGGSSVSDTAVAFCNEHDINVIPVGCPMMFCQPDFFHGLMRRMMRLPRLN